MNLAQIWSERRKIILLGLLLILLIVLLARRADLVPQGPAGRVVRTIAHPVVVAVSALDRLATRAWVVLIGAKDLQAENEDLKTELALARVRYQELDKAFTQLKQLSSLTVERPASYPPNVAARLIGISTNFWTRTITIDRGRRDRVGPDMPVVNQDGLVGIVTASTGRSAQVQLLVDPLFAAGAQIAETRDRGVVEGTGELDRLRLTLDNPQTSVAVGHTIITSGLPAKSLFPAGLKIGKIIGVDQDRFGQRYALVRPNVRFERIEAVVVLLEKQSTQLSPDQLPVPPP